MVETSVPKLEGQLSFECGSWDGPLNTSLVTMWKLMNTSCCPNPNAGLIWDVTADIKLEESDDERVRSYPQSHRREISQVFGWRKAPAWSPVVD